MAEQDLTLKIKAVDEATKTLKDIEKGIDKVEDATDKATKATDKNTKATKKNAAEQKKQSVSFTDLAGKAAGAAAAIGAIASVLSKANKEFGEQNKLNQNLSRALQNMGLNASAATTQLNLLNNQFDALSRTTNFDDEVLSQNFTKLLNVTGDLTKAQEGLQVSMDLSAMSGKSLEDTSQKILKAYNGEYMELVELGVITKEQATNFQNMANKGEATAQVMDILSGKTKDLSKNLTENEKAVREFNSDLDYLWETMGEASNTIIPRATQVLGDFIAVFRSDQEGKSILRIFADDMKEVANQWERLTDTSTGDTFGPIMNHLEARMKVVTDFFGVTEDIPVTTRGFIPNANTQPDINWDPESTFKNKQARKGTSKGSSSSSSGGPRDTRTELEKAVAEMDAFQESIEDRISSTDELYQEMLDKKFQEQEIAREQGRIERENIIKLHDLREKQRENDIKHQNWLKQQEEARMASMVANINQVSGLLQQGLSAIGGENASGLSQIVGGAAQGVASYFSGNPMGMVSGALSMAGGISSLFGQGDAARLEEERRKREEEQRKAFEAAKRERVEFQKSLQSAIVDALRESRDNLAVTYIINQSGNYLGNDNASLRQVQSALAGTGRLERNRT